MIKYNNVFNGRQMLPFYFGKDMNFNYILIYYIVIVTRINDLVDLNQNKVKLIQ